MRLSPSYSCAIVAIALVLAASPAAAQDLPLIGGSGGNSFSRTCPNDYVLSGVRWRRGAVLDAIGIKCKPVNANGTLGAEVNVGTMAGGNGGTAGSESCGSSVVAGQNGGTLGSYVGSFFLECFQWMSASRSWGGSPMWTINVIVGPLTLSLAKKNCASANAPAVGIYGRHGSLIDAVGVRCKVP